MESAGGRQPGVDDAGLIQPQERAPSRVRENKPSIHLGFAQGGCVSFFLVGVSVFPSSKHHFANNGCFGDLPFARVSMGHTCSPFYT